MLLKKSSKFDYLNLKISENFFRKNQTTPFYPVLITKSLKKITKYNFNGVPKSNKNYAKDSFGCGLFEIFLILMKGKYIYIYDNSPPPPFEIFPRRINLRQGGGSDNSPAKSFGVYSPKRCIFKAFFTVFLMYSYVFLSRF